MAHGFAFDHSAGHQLGSFYVMVDSDQPNLAANGPCKPPRPTLRLARGLQTGYTKTAVRNSFLTGIVQGIAPKVTIDVLIDVHTPINVPTPRPRLDMFY